MIIAEDASANTKKKFENAAFAHKTECIVMGNKIELGQTIGKDMRSSVAITDEGFAQQLKKLACPDKV